jgi:ribonuclease D
MDTPKPATYEYIDTPEALEAAYRNLSRAHRISVDLEADSLYHFQQKVCLLQMATNGSNYVIDPLAIPDLSPLKPLFIGENIQKIFHGADYDVRSLHRDFGIEIHNLFDTELASRFLGITETGLEAVVRQHLNVCLDKKYQKKDWSKRPLPTEMIDYAAGDVMYLLPISTNLIEDLKRKNRLDWVAEECVYLSQVRSVSNENEPLFLKVKGAGRLSPRELAALENILIFRRETARKKDKPLFKIFSNRAALALSTSRPDSLKTLRDTNILSPRQHGMYGQNIIDAITEAMELPDDKLPVYPRNRTPRPPANVEPRKKALQKWRNDKADALLMDAGLICNRNLATRLAILNPRSMNEIEACEEMKGWQKKAFGEEIVAVLKALESKN